MSSTWGVISNKLSMLSKKKFVRYGVPFMVMIVGGSFGLKEFTQLRYKFSKQQKLSRKDLQELGLDMKKEEAVSLEAVYDDVQKMDIDNWHNIRGPRPWEEPSSELVAVKNKSKAKQ